MGSSGVCGLHVRPFRTPSDSTNQTISWIYARGTILAGFYYVCCLWRIRYLELLLVGAISACAVRQDDDGTDKSTSGRTVEAMCRIFLAKDPPKPPADVIARISTPATQDSAKSSDAEWEYLYNVLRCEATSWDTEALESLKALAIAARSWTYSKSRMEKTVTFSDSQAHQVYGCTKELTKPQYQLITRAIEETNGVIMMVGGVYAMGFHVAGTSFKPVPADKKGKLPEARLWCSNAQGNNYGNNIATDHGTQQHVTYNYQRTSGDGPKRSTLGGNVPANIGAMSQNGADCLSRGGVKAEDILKTFYAFSGIKSGTQSDAPSYQGVELIQALGECVDVKGVNIGSLGGTANNAVARCAKDRSPVTQGPTKGNGGDGVCSFAVEAVYLEAESNQQSRLEIKIEAKATNGGPCVLVPKKGLPASKITVAQLYLQTHVRYCVDDRLGGLLQTDGKDLADLSQTSTTISVHQSQIDPTKDNDSAPKSLSQTQSVTVKFGVVDASGAFIEAATLSDAVEYPRS